MLFERLFLAVLSQSSQHSMLPSRQTLGLSRQAKFAPMQKLPGLLIRWSRVRFLSQTAPEARLASPFLLERLNKKLYERLIRQ
jgi:hypothetical protein